MNLNIILGDKETKTSTFGPSKYQVDKTRTNTWKYLFD
jgi:hypothetical protein